MEPRRLAAVVLVLLVWGSLAVPARAFEGYYSFVDLASGLAPSQHTRLHIQAYTDSTCLVRLQGPASPIVNGTLVFTRSFPGDCGTGTMRTITTVVELPTLLDPGPYVVSIVDADHPEVEVQRQSITVSPQFGRLLQGRFLADVTWSGFGGAGGTGGTAPAHPVYLSDESASFWFFEKRDVELTLKLVDGHAVNGKLWVFLASMTDLPFTLTLTDTQYGRCSLPGSPPSSQPPCPMKRYVSPHGNRNILDVNALSF